jgi:hypothetical protein
MVLSFDRPVPARGRSANVRSTTGRAAVRLGPLRAVSEGSSTGRLCREALRRAPSILLAAIVGVLALGIGVPAGVAEAQMVVGRTIDQAESTPVGGVELRFYLGERLVTRAMSDAEGWFRAPVPQAGTYRVSAFVFGYEPRDSIQVTVPEGQEQITIPIRMTQRPLVIQGIEVTADRALQRYLLNWTGFESRKEMLPPIGNARAVGREDPEMRSAGSVREVLRWFQPPQTGIGGRTPREILYYLDGFPVSEEQLLLLPFDLVAGVEYYRYGYESPVGGGQETVVMIWKDPPPPRDGRGGGTGGGGGGGAGAGGGGGAGGR